MEGNAADTGLGVGDGGEERWEMRGEREGIN